MPVTCDITDLAQCEAAAKQVADAWGGRIDILVNNAAFFGGMGAWRPFDEWAVDEWDKMQNVNVRGMWFMARAVFPYMKAQSYGKIINLSSSTFFQGVRASSTTPPARAGSSASPVPWAGSWASYGIRVNAIAPGFTISDAQLELTKDSQEWYERNKNVQALNQRNEVPEDLAGPAFFLASPDSDFMSCQTLLVDGGVTPH